MRNRLRFMSLYVFRPTVAWDLYRLFRSWGAPWWRCLAAAISCERSGRGVWRDVLRDDDKE